MTGPTPGRVLPVALLLAGLLALGVARAPQPTSAAWTDQGTTTNAITALTVAAPAALTCTNGSNYADVGWAHVDTAYSYTWKIVRVSNGTTAATGTITPAGAVGSTVSVRVSPSLLTLDLLNPNYDVVVTSFLTASPTWTSSAAQTTRVHAVSLLVIGLSAQCGPA